MGISPPLVLGQLSVPPLPPATIRRPRLTEAVRRGLQGPATLVCGPAGSGKTVLVASAVRRLRVEPVGPSAATAPAARARVIDRDPRRRAGIHRGRGGGALRRARCRARARADPRPPPPDRGLGRRSAAGRADHPAPR